MRFFTTKPPKHHKTLSLRPYFPSGKGVPAAEITPGERYRLTGFGWGDMHSVRATERGLFEMIFVAEPEPEGYASTYTDNNGYTRGQFRAEGTGRLYFFYAAQLEKL